MKVALVSYNKQPLLRELRKAGFRLDGRRPDVAIAFGGEGTCLFCEEAYPNIPKLFIVHHKCPRCNSHNYSALLNAIKNRKYRIVSLPKLEAYVNGKRFVGMNDINIHYRPPRAIRLQIKVNGRMISKELIGDGLVISTPYGSSAYFKSITGRTFKNGIGIAFNNSVERRRPLIVNSTSKIQIKVLRESGVVACDTQKRLININRGNTIVVKQSRQKAKIIKINGRDLRVRFK